MDYVFLLLSPLLVSVKTLTQGYYTKNSNLSIKNSMFFTALFSFVASVILGALYLRNIPSINTIIIGLILGLLTASFQLVYLFALSKGPVSISAIIISLSILLPTLYGLIFLNEPISASKIIGIILILISLVLLNISKDNNKKINIIYLILILSAFFLCGSINVVQSFFNTLEVSNERNVLLFIMYFSSFIFCSFGSLIYCPKEKINYKFNHINILSPIIIGILLAAQNVLLMYLLTIFETSIYFPVTSVLNILFITLGGKILFKDKIKTIQIAGIVLSLIALVIINLVF